MKYMQRTTLHLILISISSMAIADNNPTAVGDVVGRDLSVTGMGYLGHLGLLSNTNQVVQVMNATPFVNVVQYVTVPGFKVDTYWGARAKTKFIFKSPYKSAPSQIVSLANQQRPYVEYDLYSSTPNPATQTCIAFNANGVCTSYKWNKGSFRCDAFVKWLYNQTGNGDLGGILPSTTFMSSLLTITRL